MSDQMAPRTRGRLLAVAVLVSVFMAGGLTAAAVIQVIRASGVGSPPAGVLDGPPPGGRPGMGPGMGPGQVRRMGGPGMRDGPAGLPPMVMSRRMAQRLGLNPEQEEEIRGILERRHEVADSIMRGVFPRLRAQLDSTRAEVREVLTPEQRERFDRWNREGREGLFRRFPGDSAGG